MPLSDFLTYFFFALWLFLPAGIGNMAPILAARLNIPLLKHWDTPLDFGRTFRGKRIFGPHKTWRGLVSGIVLATATLALQQAIFRRSPLLQSWITTFDYAHLPTLIVGPLFGFGALAGDAIESFFKRQRGIPSGDSWYPFDQLDFVVSALLLTAPFIRLEIVQYVFILLVWWITNLVSSYVGYLLHLKDKPI